MILTLGDRHTNPMEHTRTSVDQPAGQVALIGQQQGVVVENWIGETKMCCLSPVPVL